MALGRGGHRLGGQSHPGAEALRARGLAARGVSGLGDSTALYDDDPSPDDTTPDWIDEVQVDQVDEVVMPPDVDEPGPDLWRLALNECERQLQTAYDPLPRKPFGLKIPWNHPVAFEHAELREACLARKPRCTTKYTKGKRVRQCWRECDRAATKAINKAHKKPRKKRAKA